MSILYQVPQIMRLPWSGTTGGKETGVRGCVSQVGKPEVEPESGLETSASCSMTGQLCVAAV